MSMFKFYPHMFFCLLLGTVCASGVLNKILEPKQTLFFTEEVGPDDQQAVFYLSNLTKEPGIRYRLITPKERLFSESKEDTSYESSGSEETEDVVGTELKNSFRNTFSTMGRYRVEIKNTSSGRREVGVAIYKFSKIHESNKDLIELRNLISSIQETMDTLATENYYLRLAQDRNFSVARFTNWIVNLMILSPIATVAIGYFKYILSRQLVKPKGKRFRGMF